MNLDSAITQAAFAELVGTSQPTISRMVGDGLLPRGGTLRVWIQVYIAELESERDALAGSQDDSADARAARVALVLATTKLREQQGKLLTREYEEQAKQFVDRLLGEVQGVLYRQIPVAVVTRVLAIVPRQEDRYAVADAMREVIAEAVERVMQSQVDEQGFLVEETSVPVRAAKSKTKAAR